MQNIGAAALFLPVVERVGERTGIAVSRLLMPMGFAAILGGTLTLVASGPLILLNDLLASSADNLGIDIEPFGLFTPTPIGLSLLVAGIALFAVAGRWLLPRSPPAASPPRRCPTWRPPTASTAPCGRSGSRGQPAHPARRRAGRGRHPGAARGRRERPGRPQIAPPREERLPGGTVIGLVGDDEQVERFMADHALTDASEDPFTSLRDEAHAGMAEVVVRPGSDAVGQRVRDLRLRKRFGVTLLAVHHRGEIVTEGLRERRLAAGDVLVVFAPWDRLAGLEGERSFVVLTDHPPEPPRTSKRWWALAAFAVALGLVIFTDLQLSLALMTGAIGVLLTGVLTPDEAYRRCRGRPCSCSRR
jgi:di/tricarboxylate transporter